MEICSKLKIVLEDNGSTDYSLFMTNNVVAENKKILQLVSHSMFMKRIEASMLQKYWLTLGERKVVGVFLFR